MKDKINGILSEVKTKISEAASEAQLQNVKSAYVGKQGSLTLLMKELPHVDPAQRPEIGKLLNQAKKEGHGADRRQENRAEAEGVGGVAGL